MFVQAFCLRLTANINNWVNKETDLHVDSHFSRLLISLLNRYHSVELTDIGTLLLKRSEAELDESRDVITAPKRHIVFDRSVEVSGITVLGAFEEGIIDERDLELMKSNLAHMKSQLVTNGLYILTGIGSFTFVNGIVELEKNRLGLGLGLSEVSLKVLEVPEEKVVVTESEIDTRKVTTITSKKEQVVLPIQKDKVIPTQGSSVGTVVKILPEAPWYHHLIPLLLLICGVVGLVSLFRYCNDSKVKTEVISEHKPLERMQDDVDPLAFSDTTKLFDHPFLERYRNVLTQEIINDGCKIAVGSFRERENAVNMMERIITEGYEAEIIDSENGSRVVIQFDCLEHDLVEYLKLVRQDISEKAWYYQPKFEPEL